MRVLPSAALSLALTAGVAVGLRLPAAATRELPWLSAPAAACRMPPALMLAKKTGKSNGRKG